MKAAPPPNRATTGNTNIPHPGITSFNTRSLSTHAKGVGGKERKSRVIKFIRQLAAKSDVICLQETNLGSLDKRALTEDFPNHLVFHNPLKFGTAGSAILVSTKYARNYTVEEVPLGERAKGRVQALRFLPAKDFLGGAHTVCNVYLLADNANGRIQCLEMIKGLHWSPVPGRGLQLHLRH